LAGVGADTRLGADRLGRLGQVGTGGGPGAPEVTEGIVPTGFVPAAAFFPAGLIVGDLAETLAAQLNRSVPRFAQAKEQFDRDLTEDGRLKLDRLHRDVLGPLNRLTGGGLVRIVVDGLDQVPTSSGAAIQSTLDALAAMPQVRLIVTARPDTPQPAGLT